MFGTPTRGTLITGASTNPPDPEAAALDLIVRLSHGQLGDGDAELLQSMAAMLDIEGAFTGMSWNDAKNAAMVIAGCTMGASSTRGRDNSARDLRARAGRVHDGSDPDFQRLGITWDDPGAVERALTTGANALFILTRHA
jgi:hypothetical protein